MTWPNTTISELLKIQLPLIQAPMAGGATTPALIAAVSNAGGLGSLGAGYMSPDDMHKAIKQIRSLTNKPFSVNLFIPENHQATENQIEQARKVISDSCTELNFPITSIKPPYSQSFDQQMKVIIEAKIPILSFTFGVLAEKWIMECKKNGIILIGTATTVAEAEMLEQCKVDAIVAQGSEAGGHRGTFIGKAEDALINTSTLISLLVKKIKIPIIAAGGLMDAQGILSAIKLGASAVQLGTAFLCCHESGIHPLYKKLLLHTKRDNTVLTRAFSGKMARGINNTFISRMQTHPSDILDYPIQNTLTTGMRKEAAKQNNTEFMSLWAGVAASKCQNIAAAELIKTLNNDVLKLQKN